MPLGEKTANCTEGIFFIHPQVLDGPGKNAFRYDGSASGRMHFYRNRYYMSGCNRFISEDPLGWASGQTNNYAYVGGNPISNFDPYGLASLCDARAWHNLQLANKVTELQIAGWQTVTDVRIQLMSANSTSYAVADYLALSPDKKMLLIGEVKTGAGQLTPNQVLNYQSGLVRILSPRAEPLGISQNDIIPATYLGVDRYPGCPN